MNACDEMGIEVLPPDVNASQVDFAVVEGKIRFGLNAVKNVGEAAAQAIVAGREAEGPFVSLWDFTERVDPQLVNKRALETLVKAGALDSTGARARACSACSSTRSRTARRSRPTARRARRRSSTTCMTSADAPKRRRHPEIPTDEFEKAELLRLEKESLGLYVSEHPLHAIRDQLRRKTDSRVADLERRRDGDVVTVGGIVAVREAPDDEEGRPDGLPVARRPHRSRPRWSSSTACSRRARELCQADTVLVVKGRVDHKQEGETKLIALEVTAFEAAHTPPRCG